MRKARRGGIHTSALRCNAPIAQPVATIVAMAALATGCAVPADHVRTLRVAPGTVGVHAPSGDGAFLPPARPGLVAVQVLMPDAMDVATWALRDGPDRVRLLQHERWPQALSAELGAALAQRLDDALAGTVPGASPAHAGRHDASPAWIALPESQGTGATRRVVVRVLSFDAWITPRPGVRDDYAWSVECVRAPGPGADPVLRAGRLRHDDGDAVSAPPVDEAAALDAVAAAHARSLDALAARIAQAWRESGAGATPACGAGTS